MDSLGIAVVLGIVEGLTEFIPVSSTGHLILVGHLLGFVGERAASFEVAIQLGAILSVVFLYWRRFLDLIPTRSAVHSDSTLSGWSGLWRITLATIPALLVGFLARHTIKEQLFTPLAVTWALAVGGVAILFAEKLVSRRRLVHLKPSPWVRPSESASSRSLPCGRARREQRQRLSVECFWDSKEEGRRSSLLIAVPIMVAATGYELVKMRGLLPRRILFSLGWGL